MPRRIQVVQNVEHARIEYSSAGSRLSIDRQWHGQWFIEASTRTLILATTGEASNTLVVASASGRMLGDDDCASHSLPGRYGARRPSGSRPTRRGDEAHSLMPHQDAKLDESKCRIDMLSASSRRRRARRPPRRLPCRSAALHKRTPRSTRSVPPRRGRRARVYAQRGRLGRCG